MNLLKSSFIAVNLSALLSFSLSAQTFNIQNKSLIEAIEEISKTTNIPYLANSSLFENKKSPDINNIEGLENVLKKVLEGTNLEAVVEDGTILIRKKVLSKKRSSNNNLGEVIITGTKLNKSLQDTVESVQVFNDVDIANSAKMDDLSDVLLQTSNVSDNLQGLTIRGIGNQGFGEGDTGPRTIDVNIDGVSQASNAIRSNSISTWDLEQVEILKGPQSTTQGRNALAGAIILKTKDPEFEANGAVKVDYSTNNTSRLSVMQTGPITDKLAFRLTAERSASDGFIENDVRNDDKYNKTEAINIRGKLLYKFENDTDATLTVSSIKDDRDGIDQIRAILDPYDRKSNSTRAEFKDSDTKSYSLDINKLINPSWSAKSVTTFSNTKFDRDSELNRINVKEYVLSESENDDFTQEFRLTYSKDKLNALFGLYFAKGTSEKDNSNFDSSIVDNLSPAINGSLINFQTTTDEDYNNMAFFTNIDYKLTDKFTLIAGLRIDKDDRTIFGSSDAQRTSEHGAALNGAIDSNLGSKEIEKDNITTNILPKIGLNYKLSNNINTGLLFSQGYRPGGVSLELESNTIQEYDAEYTDNLEFSIRSKWLDKTLTINTNIFYTKYRDMQVVENNDDDVRHIDNAGKSSLKGIEIDAKYLVNDELDIFGSVGYIKTEFLDYSTFDGNEFTYSPSLNVNLGTTYRHNSGYFISANTTYTDDSYTDSANSVITDSYTLANIKVGYERDDWAVYLYSNNLFDKEYLTRNTGDTGTYTIGDPRIVGVTLTYNW